ncbi:conjugative transfer signal peptidase TraF [Azospirillum thermophilum]|uniref:Conjugative transfer signal peptidase TraF n=1 Tax=Azospirillum thermophilum TaxID=2202148 RepID=A0A2S2CVQ0_9PROT|nr:conjugative transfer signal peptidase TraF [Azospirillum thermophilum]AWK88593.1 conjugative transfer signal peptidase TraF [Azospirillum thermophilum]
MSRATRGRRFALGVWCAAVLTSVATAAAGMAGWRINSTPSLPVGLWRVDAAGTVAPGVVVELCPPDSAPFRLARERGYVPAGSCPGGYQPLFKPIAAQAGDEVELTAEGVWVNGVLLANSRPLAADGAGRPMPVLPRGRYRVEAGTVWVVSSHHPASFDSRYFGALPLESIQGTARPILVQGAS